jgi:hypothetical protein
MALSPADFAAYSRATGTPYPEDPEERAQLAPEVAEFRRNQLKQPESEGIDPVSVGIGLGLAAAGAGGAAYGIRSFFKGRDLPKQEGQSGAKQVDLGKIARTDVDYVYGRQTGTTPPPSKEPNLTDIQDAQFTVVADQQNESVDSGSQQFLRRRLEEGQRNVTKLDESISTPQEERLGAPTNALPPSQRQIREEKITTRLEAEQAQLSRPTLPREMRPSSDFQRFSQKAETVSAEAAAQRAVSDALSAQKSRAPKNARDLQSLGPSYGLTQEEIFQRVSASANEYKPGSMQKLNELDYAALLDPSVPTENVIDLLGTQLTERGGRVGRNLDFEVMAEGGGMTERGSTVDIVGGELGSDVYAFNPRTGNYEIDTSSDLEDINLNRGRASDYDNNAADYGDVEGPGGFVSTRSFKERTKSGTTIVPGLVMEAEGAMPGSLRQERMEDRVIPARETPEGDPATGWAFDPRTGKARLVGSGTRLQETRTNVAGRPIRVVDLKTVAKRPLSSDPEVMVSTGAGGRARDPGSYQGNISVDDPSYDPTSGGKYTGRLQPATSEPSPTITTQPIMGYLTAQERLIQDDKGNWHVNQAKTKVTGQEPLKGYVGSDPNLKELSLNRSELNSVLNNASQMWSAKGGGNALERQTFLIKSLDDYLKTEKQTKLSVLQPNAKGFLSSAAFDFINNVQPGLKESNVYVKPAKVNAEGRPLVQRQTLKSGQVRENPVIDPSYENMEAVPLPGRTKISGAGGVSAQEVDTDAYEGAVSFFSPRIETAPQRALPTGGRPDSGEQGSVVSRPYLETRPVGYKVKSPGSFARTQNPYTGAAAAAMGPASRVLSGDYQYKPRQLAVNVSAPSQLQELNLYNFTQAAEATPGGRVVRGAQQMGAGLGAIPAGLGGLTESETVTRYGATGSQLQQFGNQLMAQAAYKRGQQPGPTSATQAPQQGPTTPPMQAPSPASSTRQAPTSTEMAGYARRPSTIPEAVDPIQARNDAVARHIGNYISAASQRLEGGASIAGAKLKGVGQNALRPYQEPSEGMIQQLMRAVRRR